MIRKITINRLLTIFTYSCFLLLLITLSGCSPHPGAGNWKADDTNSLNISRINITYEGRADFFAHGKEESIRRCFWSAIAERTMKMQCVHAQDTEKKVNYQFIITDKGHAKLLLDEQLIGHFSAQAPASVKPVVAYFSDVENSLHSDNQHQKNKQPQAFCK